MGFLGNRRLQRALGPDQLVMKATPQQIVEAVERASTVLEGSDPFSKNVVWRPEVKWSSTDEDGRALIYYHRYNTKKEQISLTTFIVQVEWAEVEGGEYQAVTISTVDAIVQGDRVSAHQNYEDLRLALLRELDPLDRDMYVVALRYG